MTVKDFQEQLKLAKNKDAELVFLVGERIVKLDMMAEVVLKDGETNFPLLGETPNAVAVRLVIVEEVDL